MSRHTQLAESNYDASNMIFGEPEERKIPGSVLSYQTIKISTRNPDGSIGDLVIKTEPELFSFGVKQFIDQNDPNKVNYNLSLCLFTMNSPTKEQREWVNMFDSIVDKCADYIVSVKDDINKPSATKQFILAPEFRFNPIFWKQEETGSVGKNGKKIMKPIDRNSDKASPTLNVKLMHFRATEKRPEKFESRFYVQKGGEFVEIDPLELLERKMYITCAIKVDSIYIGAKPSIQFKVYEASIDRFSEQNKVSLLRPRIKLPDNSILFNSQDENDDIPLRSQQVETNNFQSLNNDDETNSLDDEYVPPPQIQQPTPKKVIRKPGVKRT